VSVDPGAQAYFSEEDILILPRIDWFTSMSNEEAAQVHIDALIARDLIIAGLTPQLPDGLPYIPHIMTSGQIRIISKVWNPLVTFVELWYGSERFYNDPYHAASMPRFVSVTQYEADPPPDLSYHPWTGRGGLVYRTYGIAMGLLAGLMCHAKKDGVHLVLLTPNELRENWLLPGKTDE
jgi:hypothetical protein